MSAVGAAFPVAERLRHARRAKRVLPLPVFDFADGGAEDSRTLRRNEPAFKDVTLLPRPLNGAAARDLSRHALRQAPVDAARHRPDRARRSVLAGRGTGLGAGGASGRHLLLRQPWFGLHAGGNRRRDARPALDAGLRLYRSRLHARNERPRRGGRFDALVLTIDNQLLATASATVATASPSRRASACRHAARGDQGALAPCACAPACPSSPSATM